jgi:hypothetical protein
MSIKVSILFLFYCVLWYEEKKEEKTCFNNFLSLKKAIVIYRKKVFFLSSYLLILFLVRIYNSSIIFLVAKHILRNTIIMTINSNDIVGNITIIMHVMLNILNQFRMKWTSVFVWIPYRHIIIRVINNFLESNYSISSIISDNIFVYLSTFRYEQKHLYWIKFMSINEFQSSKFYGRNHQSHFLCSQVQKNYWLWLT